MCWRPPSSPTRRGIAARRGASKCDTERGWGGVGVPQSVCLLGVSSYHYTYWELDAGLVTGFTATASERAHTHLFFLLHCCISNPPCSPHPATVATNISLINKSNVKQKHLYIFYVSIFSSSLHDTVQKVSGSISRVSRDLSVWEFACSQCVY